MFKFILILVIAAVIIGGVAVLLAKILHNNRDKRKYITAVLLLLLVVFVIILPSLLISQAFTVREVFSYVSNQLNYIGIPIWFARAIVIVLIFPFLWAAKKVLLRGRKKSVTAYVIFSTYIAAYFITMGIGMKDHIKGKYYGRSKDGLSYVIWDRPGIDPYWGDSLKPVTPTIKRMIQRQETIEWDEGELENAFFHPATGIPLKYYTVDDEGLIHMYDTPGFDPLTGEERKEINQDIAARFWQQSDSLNAIKAAKAKAQQHIIDSIKQVQDSINQIAAAADRLRRLRRMYLNNPSFKGYGSKEATVYVNAGELGAYKGRIEQTVQKRLEEAGYQIRPFPFTQSFVDEGYLKKLSRGDASFIRRLKLSKCDGRILVLSITLAESQPPSAGTMIVREYMCLLRITSLDGKVMKSEQIPMKGVGQDKASYSKQAVDDLVRRLQQVDL